VCRHKCIWRRRKKAEEEKEEKEEDEEEERELLHASLCASHPDNTVGISRYAYF